MLASPGPYAAAVHAALKVRLDSANTIGRALMCAISSSASRVKDPPVAATPMMAVGFGARTAARKSPTGA